MNCAKCTFVLVIKCKNGEKIVAPRLRLWKPNSCKRDCEFEKILHNDDDDYGEERRIESTVSVRECAYGSPHVCEVPKIKTSNR